MRTTRSIVVLLSLAAGCSMGCSKRDASPAASDSAVASATSGAAATSAPPGDSIIRGTVAQVGDTMLTLTVAGSEVRIAIAPPMEVYGRKPADLASVTAHSFVGVTSVSQPDGTQRATEIHIFPEALRGLGEGSRPMGQPTTGAAAGGTPSTMTNGTVSNTMTNGTVAVPRMTNGAVQSKAGGTLDVAYGSGTQSIVIPAGVTVTAIAPTTDPLTAGANVVVLARKRADGTLSTSRVLLAAPAPKR